MNRKEIPPIHIAVLLLAVAVVFCNALGNGFVWDDGMFVNNAVYRSLNVRAMFFSLANGFEYQPVRDITFLFDFAVWKTNPFGFHLTNIVIYFLNVVAVYLLAVQVQRLLHPENAGRGTDGRLVPLMTALLFAVHPLHDEAAAFVTGRNTLVSGLFFFLATWFFLRFLLGEPEKAGRFYPAAIIAFLLAILSKATVIILPLLLVLFVAFHPRRSRSRSDWLRLVPFFLISMIFFGVFVAIGVKTKVIQAGATAGGDAWSQKVLLALQIPFFYIRKIFAPVNLSVIYERRFGETVHDTSFLLAAGVLAVLFVLAIFARKRFPELPFALGWFIITLIPVLNFFSTNPVVANRYAYLPSFGVFYLVSAATLRLLPPQRGGTRAVAATMVLMVIPLGVLSFQRNRVWKSDITLWQDTVRKSPAVSDVWYNLGRAQHGVPRLYEALEAYLRALSINPSDMKSLDNAAVLFPHTEEYRSIRASLVYDLVAQLPPYPHGIALVGHTAREWRDPARAEVLFRRLLSVSPDSDKGILALGNLFLKRGDPDAARIMFQKVLERGKDEGESAYNLACLEAASGRQAEAFAHLRVAAARGFNPKGLLETDPYLSAVRNTPEFRRLAAEFEY